MICIGKMDGSIIRFMDEAEYGIDPIPWDVIAVDGLLRRRTEQRFRTIGTVREYQKRLSRHFAEEEIREWM